MYIWTAIDVDDQLAALRAQVERISGALCMQNSALTLPLHVSLRMSFPIDDDAYQQAVAHIDAFLRDIPPFVMRTEGIARHGDIIWCAMEGSRELQEIHARLVDMLSAAFGVGAHPFDGGFLYHATLFMGGSDAQTDTAFSRISQAETPETLRAERFVIGASETGKAGDFRVIRHITGGQGGAKPC